MLRDVPYDTPPPAHPFHIHNFKEPGAAPAFAHAFRRDEEWRHETTRSECHPGRGTGVICRSRHRCQTLLPRDSAPRSGFSQAARNALTIYKMWVWITIPDGAVAICVRGTEKSFVFNMVNPVGARQREACGNLSAQFGRRYGRSRESPAPSARTPPWYSFMANGARLVGRTGVPYGGIHRQ